MQPGILALNLSTPVSFSFALVFPASGFETEEKQIWMIHSGDFKAPQISVLLLNCAAPTREHNGPHSSCLDTDDLPVTQHKNRLNGAVDFEFKFKVCALV